MPADRRAPTADELAALRDAQVPLVSLLEACRNCDDPCEEAGSSSSSSNIFETLDVDLDSNLLGSVKTNGRTVLVATGKSDWVHSVTDEEGLYAHTIAKAYEAHLKTLPPLPTAAAGSYGAAVNGSHSRCVKGIEGLEDSWTDASATERKRNMTILCSNLRKYEPYGSDALEEEGTETVMIFPDYKLVTNCPSTSADDLVASHLSPLQTGRLPRSVPGSAGTGTAGSTTMPRAFTLPYYAVILVCSHKRRDKRCSLTADPLIDALRIAIEQLGGAWHVDTHGNDEELLSRRELPQARREQDAMEIADEARLDAELRKLSSTETRADANTDKHVGIFKVSHVGGHRYSGQVMLWFPNGVNVWYGRVRDGDCKAIVHETLLGGRVIPELLRGGTGLGGRGDSVLAW